MGDVGSARLTCGWGQEKVGVHLGKFPGVTRDCCAQMEHGWSKGLEVHDPQGGMRRCGHREAGHKSLVRNSLRTSEPDSPWLSQLRL